MSKLIDKLWNWGHLEGSHNKILKLDCKMSPEAFAEEYGIRNSFIVSYGGNIQPPYTELAKRFSVLNEVKWSVLGDAGTPLPAHELGNTPDVCEAADAVHNITGGVVDDFFSKDRLERFTPDVLKKIRSTLNEKGLDFWCVLYKHQLEVIEKYLDCFDGVTFWIWHSKDIAELDETLDKLFSIVGDKPVMLGVYLWDYSSHGPISTELFEKQVKCYFELLKNKRIEGVIFCSNTIGDADLETNKSLKRMLREYGDTEI